ncbi:MAG: reverse transcriptase family protein [Labrys sp. (in: a-proteobacteria)]
MQKKSLHYAINQSPLYKLKSKKRLADLLRLCAGDLRRLARNSDGLYTEFKVAKKAGGDRLVQNPHRQLKLVQARIARLLGRVAPPSYLFCPVKGRCYVSNAAQHRGQRVLRCLDVRRYFPSTSSKRVYWFFSKIMLCSSDVAAVLARIACLNGCLPTGIPLSPIMAYFAHYDVWEAIARVCKEKQYVLTVYIDDVTISGASLLPDVIWQVKQIIHRAGLRYHKEKRFVGRSAEVTGVIVDGDRLLPPNRQLKKLYEMRKSITEKHNFEVEKKVQAQISGMKGQIAQISSFNER